MALREQIWRGVIYFDFSIYPWHAQKSHFGCRTEESKGKGAKLPAMKIRMLPKDPGTSEAVSLGPEGDSTFLRGWSSVCTRQDTQLRGKLCFSPPLQRGDFHRPLQSL